MSETTPTDQTKQPVTAAPTTTKPQKDGQSGTDSHVAGHEENA
jgi:hypothetical protein